MREDSPNSNPIHRLFSELALLDIPEESPRKTERHALSSFLLNTSPVAPAAQWEHQYLQHAARFALRTPNVLDNFYATLAEKALL